MWNLIWSAWSAGFCMGWNFNKWSRYSKERHHYLSNSSTAMNFSSGLWLWEPDRVSHNAALASAQVEIQDTGNGRDLNRPSKEYVWTPDQRISWAECIHQDPKQRWGEASTSVSCLNSPICLRWHFPFKQPVKSADKPPLKRDLASQNLDPWAMFPVRM